MKGRWRNLSRSAEAPRAPFHLRRACPASRPARARVPPRQVCVADYLSGTRLAQLHPERHRARPRADPSPGPPPLAAGPRPPRAPRSLRARPRSRLPEGFAFAFLPMSLRKMKAVVARTGAAAVSGEGRRMQRPPAWSAGPGAAARAGRGGSTPWAPHSPPQVLRMASRETRKWTPWLLES
ncbi:uncharacterized protein IRF1-AS1 [Pan paniscus]|uniref:uncharacterized protein IRF1-AS1 n=1 Tax=Pan paniscus TaxID=9597 RepID=UPI001560386D